MRRGEVTDELRESVESAQRREQSVLQSLLRPPQVERLRQRLGAPFDTSKLQRIYPMAPELVDSGHWINTSPLTMRSLRGKIVLVHFYAFQCHNCHANFPIYKRWHSRYHSSGDVVVLGIQTPETSAEADPARVRQAAQEEGIEFPVLIDLDKKNWQAWGNTMWPTVYVVDQDGYIRLWWQGELNWQGATGDQTIEQLIDSLLRH
ncbi:MAG: hypothetical protein KatS3mg105_5211 [Gemmatales bacterium]|nr:MAG: hypothetical protein KatS3mg105_5211 [Gemmatales bacterium]GIW99810.1 MAG: hypothetical protein KatS3mg111_3143 [Pirellulaceae bacterium]